MPIRYLRSDLISISSFERWKFWSSFRIINCFVTNHCKTWWLKTTIALFIIVLGRNSGRAQLSGLLPIHVASSKVVPGATESTSQRASPLARHCLAVPYCSSASSYIRVAWRPPAPLLQPWVSHSVVPEGGHICFTWQLACKKEGTRDARPVKGYIPDQHSLTSALCSVVKAVTGLAQIQGWRDKLHLLTREWQGHIADKQVGYARKYRIDYLGIWS